MAEKYEYKPQTAADVMAPYGDDVTREADKMAEEAGVMDAAHVDYEVALGNYESRSDIETLDRRRAREIGRSFEEADFRRKVEEQEEGLFVTDTVTVMPATGEVTGGDSKTKNPKKDK